MTMPEIIKILGINMTRDVKDLYIKTLNFPESS